ncbi:MAG: hypothetical protein GXZ11_08110 [Tissierellia bacterium]|nr:hypothetical protein [Tissierellia bacterium]
MSVLRRNAFDIFYEKRSFLIKQYEMGDLSKREFLEANFDSVQSLNIKPFSRVDSYEKGLFNYQYYNSMAKYYRMMAQDVRNTKKHRKYYSYYYNKGNNYYHEKDKATLTLMKFLDFQGMEAYYIKVQSKGLKDKLFEIVFNDYKEAIFHSKAQWLKDILIEMGIFFDERRSSLIDQYINDVY